MPYLPHIKTSFIGKFSPTAAGAPVETWTFSLKWAPTNPADIIGDAGQAQSDSVAQAAGQTAGSVFGNSRFGTNVHMTECRTYTIGPDGKAVGSIGYWSPISPYSGTGTPIYPWQVSTAVSLVAAGRGKGKFGRIYLPPLTYPVATDGLLSQANATALTDTMRAWFISLDTALGTALTRDVQLVVAGETGSGTLRPVREVRVGRVLDTQRRRRRSLPEGYSTLPYPS